METAKNFFDSFKEFIWDIIGYFLPGSYILILLSACINKSYFIEHNIEAGSGDRNFLVFFIISYIIGYVVYGISGLKEKLFGKKSYTKRIEEQTKEKIAFKISRDFISKDLKNKESDIRLETASLRELRNIAMSFVPESDQKIYTFTFRSEVCNNIGNVSFFTGLVGIILYLINFFTNIRIFNLNKEFIILYIILILSYYPLAYARNRFYGISISLPFSIYTSKYLNK